MPRYERDYGLNTALPSTGKSGAYSRLAQSLQAFGGTADRIGANFKAQQAQRDAGRLEPSTEAPELRSPATVYGANYNEVVLKGHIAATQNAMSRHISALAAQHPRDPVAFASAAQEIRNEYLNNVSPQARQAAAISFDAYSNNLLRQMQADQAQDQMQASLLEQKEGLDNLSNTAFESLAAGDDQQFMTLTTVYENALRSSTLTETEKVKALIAYKRNANMAVSNGEIRDAIKSGNYAAAIDHVQAVRDGRIPMLFGDTGMSNDDAADYLQAKLSQYVSDYETELSTFETMAKLDDAKKRETWESTRNAAYDLMADGALTVDWVRSHREDLGDDYGEFLEAAAKGGIFDDIDPSPDAYISLMNQAERGDDVKLLAEAAYRSGQIKKEWYDQITNRITDKRFGTADRIISESLKIDNSISPFARASYAEAMAQWERWKESHPDATQREAMEESRALVRDTLIVGEEIDRFALPRPRNVQWESGEKSTRIDIGATRRTTAEAFMSRLPPDMTDDEKRAALVADPDFIAQSELIARWEKLQARMVER